MASYVRPIFIHQAKSISIRDSNTNPNYSHDSNSSSAKTGCEAIAQSPLSLSRIRILKSKKAAGVCCYHAGGEAWVAKKQNPKSSCPNGSGTQSHVREERKMSTQVEWWRSRWAAATVSALMRASNTSLLLLLLSSFKFLFDERRPNSGSSLSCFSNRRQFVVSSSIFDFSVLFSISLVILTRRQHRCHLRRWLSISFSLGAVPSSSALFFSYYYYYYYHW